MSPHMSMVPRFTWMVLFGVSLLAAQAFAAKPDAIEVKVYRSDAHAKQRQPEGVVGMTNVSSLTHDGVVWRLVAADGQVFSGAHVYIENVTQNKVARVEPQQGLTSAAVLDVIHGWASSEGWNMPPRRRVVTPWLSGERVELPPTGLATAVQMAEDQWAKREAPRKVGTDWTCRTEFRPGIWIATKRGFTVRAGGTTTVQHPRGLVAVRSCPVVATFEVPPSIGSVHELKAQPDVLGQAPVRVVIDHDRGRTKQRVFGTTFVQKKRR